MADADPEEMSHSEGEDVEGVTDDEDDWDAGGSDDDWDEGMEAGGAKEETAEEAEIRRNRLEAEEMSKKFTGQGSGAATMRLISDLQQLGKVQGEYGFRAEPRGDNLYMWDVYLDQIDEKSLLGKDLEQWSSRCKREKAIHMEMIFPPDYPLAPPFLRVLRPRFKFLTGHVTVGGSVCMQLLTNNGWSPANTIESVIVQVRTEILTDERARLDDTGNVDTEYTMSDAKAAFDRMCRKYGW
mmetsp:Transcript_86401/g.119898  ORF Transcript_86401/g.119898 Transcript_86401/m.119898 type:complete len:240 (+) Transcript_86401:80-799(+)